MNIGAPGTGRQVKGLGSAVAGVALCILGGVLAVTFASLLFSFGAMGMGSTAARFVFAVMLAAGTALTLSGVRRISLYRMSRHTLALMRDKERERLSVLVQHTRRDYTCLVRDLRELVNRGVFPGGYVDLIRREFVAAPGGPQPPVVQGNTQLQERRAGSATPIYLIGATWLLYGFVFPLYRWQDFAVAAALSIFVFVVSGRVIPKRTLISEVARKVEPPKPAEKINTGNEELDEVLTAAMGYMNELTALDIAITNERIDGPVQNLVHICKQIFDYVRKTPGKVRQLRQFINYYLPTTIRLLKNYDELSRQPMKGDNIKSTMEKIEETIVIIEKAFQKELDDLYSDKAMDITVDIEVLQQMMEQEGLTGGVWQPGKTQ